jgi:4-hydroxy 2-oxovalerate aldolase
MQKDDKKIKKNDAEGWISYRSELKIVDCTIRDGGLMNDHKFEDKIVKAVYNACVQAGIDYMELGYKTSKKIFAKGEQGTWKYCDEDDIKRIVGDNDTSMKLSVMADAERTDYKTDIVPSDQSPLDIIRIATYIHQIPTTLDMVKDAHDKGYETTVNLMAVSTVPEREIDEALEILAESEVDIVYLVDSFGALYSEQTHYLIQKYLSFMEPAGKTVGMHAHNNQQLAYSNTIEAIIKGANMVDGSLAGLGRGAGNCPLELLVGFLHNPKYKLRPLFQCIQDEIEPMREKLRWGFNIPYMITGILNQHPRTAIAFDKSDDRDDLVKFYNQMIDQD